MSGRIADADVVHLRERADIAAIVSGYTALSGGGTRLKGLCPFHEERTPSFYVDTTRNRFHCFGCEAGGDVYEFVMRAEALSFPEAVERLARALGHELRYESMSPGQRKALGRRTRLEEALEASSAFWQRRLADDDGAPAREYLAGRGMDDEACARFRLGWAPDRWDALARHLLAEDFGPDEIVDAGVASDGGRGPMDRLRGRVVFPILDAGGRSVLGFGGRVLPGVALQTGPRDGAPPKYLNTPETEVYKKSRVLYGLSWARVDVQRLQAALVVEGYFDVVGLHLAGVRNAVATCGTALTAEHLRLLERYAPRVVLALDADDAGFAAAERARALAAEVGVGEVSVLPLPAGTDPADLAARGAEAVRAALAATVTAVEFQIVHTLRGADLSTPERQVAAYRATFALLAGLEDRVLRYRYVRDVVAPAVRVSADRIERELDDAASAPSDGRGGHPAATRDVVRLPGPGDLSRPPRDAQMALERLVLGVALQRPDLLPASWADVTAEDFRAPASRQLFAALGEGGALDDLLARLPDDDTRVRVRGLAMTELEVEPDEAHVAQLLRRLRAAAVARRKDEVLEALRELPGDDGVRAASLSQELYRLEQERRALSEGRTA